MTNEMQLAQAAGLPLDFGNGINGNQRSKPIGFKKIHRLLRGRYPLVIVMGILFGIAGALTGYLSQQPLYSSEFTLEINPTIPIAASPVDEQITGYERLLQTQIATIKSPELIQRAMEEDEWKSAGGPPESEGTLLDFDNSLTASNYPEDTAMIRVSFSSPDRGLAYAGAQAILKAYSEFFDQTDPMMYSRKLQSLDTEKNRYQNEMSNDSQQLREIGEQFNTDDLPAYESANAEEFGRLGSELADAKMQLSIDEHSLSQIQPGIVDANGNPTTRSSALTEEQIEALDGGVLKQMKAQRQDIVSGMEQMRLDGYGDNNPKMLQFASALRVKDQEIQEYIRSMEDSRVEPNGGLTSIRGEIIMLRNKIDYLQNAYDKQQAKCDMISKYLPIVTDLTNKITIARTNLERTESAYDSLSSVQALNQHDEMRVLRQPVYHSDPTSDKRHVMAVFGFVGGAALPTLVVLLLSLLDGRFRYSDEANNDLAGIPLLGILPNLPDLLTDPNQAATAAHCVHQIRTILQITGQSTERRVFTITSGSPGDGKTSLTLALGLSFAASGSRTLLVDGDLIGGGLTARLNVNAEHGILEAMASRDIGPFIRTTDVADLSFLPVGRAMGGYTGTISPAAVRRLVDEARKQFDIILIDTGPILGSIEASPVAVASDGVVLCVARGQQRQLVDRALAHLHAIGAKLAGVVFNRAQAHDFERSTNRLGLSSVPAGSDGRRSEAIGPVARAVASSVRSSGSASDH